MEEKRSEKLEVAITTKFSDLSREQIILLFDWYDFKDSIGHSLTRCQPFLDLLTMALKKDVALESIHGTVAHSDSK